MEQALSDLKTAVRDHDWLRVNYAVAALEKALAPVAFSEQVAPDPVMSLEPVNAALEGDEA